MRLPRLRAETLTFKNALMKALRRAGTQLLGARNDRMGKGFHCLYRDLGGDPVFGTLHLPDFMFIHFFF